MRPRFGGAAGLDFDVHPYPPPFFALSLSPPVLFCAAFLLRARPFDLTFTSAIDAGRELLLKLAALMDIHPRRVARAKEMAEAAAKLAAKPAAKPATSAPSASGKKGGKKHR